MVFASPAFLFLFFPIFYGIYFLIPRVFRNNLVLLASFAFYFLGAGVLTLVAILLILLNWGLAILIGHSQKVPCQNIYPRAILAASVVINLMPLFFFKYLTFLIQVMTDITGLSFVSRPSNWGIALPLGISFYTFHFISYLSDVYRRHIKPDLSLQTFALYIFLFPHLIAGPIVRFSEVRQQLDVKRRRLVKKDIFWGLAIFVIGLGKKLLIADPLGSVVGVVHHPDCTLTTYAAWLSAISYSFQIYFDFSGYTDMAIGMARTLGFRFPHNFNRPYASYSITDFWKRWHMTLSRWFRDYVYIPLGGNRITVGKTYRNLFVVFVLCGLWHGAAYTFLVWGVGHGFLMVLERSGYLRLDKLRLASIPVFLIATLLWVPFRAESMSQAIIMLRAMSGLDAAIPLWVEPNKALADFKVIFLLLLSFAICLIGDGVFYRLRGRCFRRPLLVGLYIFIVYVLSCISVVEHGFTPFIYFQF
jgi:alginate O-acetyltransferase complex protein AlgI